MKYTRFIILFVAFIGIVIYINKRSTEDVQRLNKYLVNNVTIEGYVIDFKQSNNHAFGIIRLQLTKSNAQNFNKEIKEGIYPYRIEKGVAELYCTVSVERKKGDIVNLISNKQTIYYNPQDSKEEGNIYIITDPTDINFVKKNTEFK